MGLLQDLNFSKYGKDNTQPLSLETGFEDKLPLTSINCRFPSSDYAFTLIIPNTVKNIKSNVFSNVKNVNMELTFGNGMSIEDGAFESCSGLKSLKFQGSIKKKRRKRF